MFSTSMLFAFLTWQGLMVGVQQTAPLARPFAQEPGIAATVVTGARFSKRVSSHVLYLQPIQKGFGGSFQPYVQIGVTVKVF